MSKAKQYRHNLDKAKRQAKHERQELKPKPELDPNGELLELIYQKIIKGI